MRMNIHLSAIKTFLVIFLAIALGYAAGRSTYKVLNEIYCDHKFEETKAYCKSLSQEEDAGFDALMCIGQMLADKSDCRHSG